MRVLVPALSLFCLLATAPRLAEAQAVHERVEVKEIKSKGEVIGARIKLTLRPDHLAWKEVRIGIAPSGSNEKNDYQARALDPKKGFLLHQFPAITNFQKGQPKEVTLEVKYADAPKLKPGSQIEVVSAWVNGSSVHIWGMSRRYVDSPSYKLPGQSQAQNLAKRTRGVAAKRFAKATPLTNARLRWSSSKAGKAASRARARARAKVKARAKAR